MIIALRSIVKCEVLGLDQSFEDNICFGHVFLRLVSMMKRFAKALDLFPSNIHSKICRNA
jgi:hypothetical protein